MRARPSTTTLVLAATLVAACGRASSTAPSASRAESLARRIPDALGAERAVTIATRFDLTDERVFAREDSIDTPSRPLGAVRFITLLAGLRSGVIAPDVRFTCTGYLCARAHGEIGVADALPLTCNQFFEDLAGRLGSGPLGAAFASLGFEPPPIPEDRTRRIELATRSSGWEATPRRMLLLARAMATRPSPWFDGLDEGLVLREPDAVGLRGVVTGDETGAWFVGFAPAPASRLLVVRVAGCRGSCSSSALRVARWTVERVHPAPTFAPPRAPPARRRRP